MRQAYLRMHFAILLWGFTAILGALIQLDEGLLVWYRMGISAAATALFLYLRGRLVLPSPSLLKKISLIGLLITLHWITFYGAIKASNVSIAISCFSSVAVFTALLEPLRQGKKPRKAELWLALAVSAGIYILFSVQELYLKGILLSLTSAFLAALFTILNKEISHEAEPGTLTLFELLTGFLLLSALLPLWFKVNGTGFFLPSAHDWMYLLILAVVCTTFAFTLSLYALQKLDAFTMNLSVNLEPLYSILLAIVILNEHKVLGPKFYAGSLIILSAVVWHGYLRFREQRLHRKTSKSETN